MEHAKSPYNKARENASRVIARVLTENESLKDSLNYFSASFGAEKKWIQDVASGVVRWQGRIDYVLDQVCKKKKPTGRLLRALQMATYQIFASERVNSTSVVFETVDYIKATEGEKPAKFANAILRRFTSDDSIWRTQPKQLKHEMAWFSLPPWIYKRVKGQYGKEWADRFAIASLERPKPWVRSIDPLPSSEADAGPVPGSWLLKKGDPTKLSNWQTGRVISQDIASQFLVNQVSSFFSDQKEKLPQILDLCAAPGGKTVGMEWNGFSVTATDKKSARFERLEQTLKRVNLENVKTISYERALESKWDVVWVDAPCTGIGTLRKNPEIRWLRTESDLNALIELQRDIVKTAINCVRPGGWLVYSVCSVLKEEGSQVFRELKLKPEREWLLSPHESLGADGFWGAIFSVQ